ncbi:MAG: hypothetical protein L0Y43_04875 [Methylococcaceae bacterium]|nr:hypothetical protein [Methylococcaceae bacterium]
MDYYGSKKSISAKTKTAATVLCVVALSAPGQVVSGDFQFSDELFQLTPVTEMELQENRGGFVTRNGIRFEFGFEKSTFVNNINVFHTEFKSNENIRLSGNETFQQGNIGLQNANLPAVLNVINNSSANQFIRDVTTINVRLSDVGVIQRSGLQSLSFGVLPAGGQ